MAVLMQSTFLSATLLCCMAPQPAAPHFHLCPPGPPWSLLRLFFPSGLRSSLEGQAPSRWWKEGKKRISPFRKATRELSYTAAAPLLPQSSFDPVPGPEERGPTPWGGGSLGKGCSEPQDGCFFLGWAGPSHCYFQEGSGLLFCLQQRHILH